MRFMYRKSVVPFMSHWSILSINQSLYSIHKHSSSFVFISISLKDKRRKFKLHHLYVPVPFLIRSRSFARRTPILSSYVLLCFSWAFCDYTPIFCTNVNLETYNMSIEYEKKIMYKKIKNHIYIHQSKPKQMIMLNFFVSFILQFC